MLFLYKSKYTRSLSNGYDMLCNKSYIKLLLLCNAIVILFLSFFVWAGTDIFITLNDSCHTKRKFYGSTQINYNSYNNTNNFNFTTHTNIIWLHKNYVYSFLGNINNTLRDHRNFLKYHIGIRARYNIDLNNFLFTQQSWLNNKRNQYDLYNMFIIGWGRQILKGPTCVFRVEIGPGIYLNQHSLRILGYALTSCGYQFTENIKFIQGISIFKNSMNSIFNSETNFDININKHWMLKFMHHITWSIVQPGTNTNMLLSLVYKMG